MTRATRTGRAKSAGFTLIEMLVVVGIIAILIAILVPVVASVRKAAYTADSKSQIAQIGNAIDRYYQDHNAYPGLFSNSDITLGVSASAPGTRKVTGLSSALTSAENLVLSLCGGVSGPLATQAYSSSELGRGPISMGLVQKRSPAYIDITPNSASVSGSSLDPVGIFGNGGTADKGANDTLQYNYTHMQPYFDPAASSPTGVNTTDFPANGTFSAGVQAYFGNTSLSTATLPVPKRKDSYMLISPGQDRKYGTSDDICNFSF